MVSTIHILLQPINSCVLKPVSITTMGIDALEVCAGLIRTGGYSSEYDINGDGYLTAEDYNSVYNLFYSRYNEWHSESREADIRTLVRISRYTAGLTPVDNAYDLDNDGVISKQDAAVCRRWLIFGKTGSVKLK